ncbi:MHS family MFS transporter (plasmid) [Escherichia coli]|uniref:MFS transporter n=1 Tax=Escherichia coli TaxID=562 RepID=UPI00077507B3|nr:MFS transporter [Escherichia coli]EFC2195458.1 MFS transporter [Escherichia coli]EFD5123816.1 MHS family MFS transporter [Escherichia coli]EFH2678050.1 MFS transporter [Escherichia coli]EFO0471332.1 MFS transporter [Escherichia coli]EGC4635691.1 MHS family MFS transporter [Escherichia coli]
MADIITSDGKDGLFSPQMKRVLYASIIGSVIEWYDFVIYGTAAALVFNQLFFPAVDPAIGVILSLGTYAVGYFSRPLGGVIFGHFGDRFGRKAMLALTLIIMGVGTFLIGCMPTYQQIGIWAPILLIILRFIQGLGIGGEWGGSVALAVEYAPKGQRGLIGSFIQLGYPLGVLLSTGAFALVTLLPQESFMSWGWRVPFLISIVLVFVGAMIRLYVRESPVFQEAQQAEKPPSVPFLDILRYHRSTFFTAIGLKLSEIAWVVTITVFGVSYVTQHLGLPKTVILNGLICAAVLELFTIPLAGYLSDRFGRRPLFFAGCIFAVLAAFPLFMLFDTRDPTIIAITVAVAVSLGQGIMFGPEAAWMCELFPTHLRYTGASMGMQIGGALGGGIVPVAAASLLIWAGGSTWAVSLMLIFIALMTIWATWFARETATTDL